MKIHFLASIFGNIDNYRKILDSVERLGHEIITDHFLTRKVSQIEAETLQESKDYVKKYKNWIKEADIVICEASFGDLSIGFEAQFALQFPKPLIVLVEKNARTFPYTLLGMESDYLQLLTYDAYNIKQTLKSAIHYAREAMDSRFHIRLSNNINNYLNKVAKESDISKAAAVRQIILDHMGKDGSQK